MSIALIGLVVGLVFAIADYMLFGMVLERAKRRGESGSGVAAIDLARKAQLVLFPILGWFLGPLLYRYFGGG
ncbi:hypothetical protein [Afifella marina]|uniref:Uncharacterized protein n=1 Tax=Afifella marina DSM 2698 TaxID=1120955 RepID=A0A1G5NM72_AFIMA|nr:hypothetical protein [Afifella marina]MBK1623691.1 hypothetical protein [Afifella marina DSM 2698]MBK1626684.1 hypothetical protein [Afifella marina]MBK5916233.1 hypothetical protein [Afifella marina]RAI21575.1 hypothetical protein CH311_06025 [Afifella marina DSM 2698]SCZ37700.1 hypothetical protein SAMN03080610_02238 [Afifella marina DSM 2698]